MQTFETAAVISLVDHLSAPLRALADHVSHQGTVFDKHVEKMQRIGEKMSYSVSLPLFEVGKHMMDHALEFSKVENTLQGVLENRARTMKGLTQTSEAYAMSQRKLIDLAADQAFRDTGGQSNTFEFHKSSMAGIKAGFDTEAANAIAAQSVNLALAGRIDQHEATDQLITLANSFGVRLKDAEGRALPAAELNKNIGRLADLLATMSTNANMTEKEAFESLKLAAPMARFTKMSPGQLGAVQESLAEAGFKGSEAGVAMRSIMNAFTGPKSTAVPMFKDAGLDINKYRDFKAGYDMGPEHFEKYIRGFNYKVADDQVRRAYAQAHSEADASHGALTWQGALPDYLAPIIRSAGKKQQPVAPNVAQKRVMDFISAGVETIDMFGSILEMREKHLTAGQLKRFMEGRQIPRAMSIMAAPEEGANDPFDIAMRRNFGDDWHSKVEELKQAGRSWNDVAKYFENATRLAKHHAEDVEGAYRHIGNSWENLQFKLYKAGAFDAAAHGIDHLAHIVDKISEQSPGMLKFEAGALAFAAGIGPVLFLTANMLKAGKALTVLAEGIGAITGLKAVTTAAAPLEGAGGAAKAVVASVKPALGSIGDGASHWMTAYMMTQWASQPDLMDPSKIILTPEQRAKAMLHPGEHPAAIKKLLETPVPPEPPPLTPEQKEYKPWHIGGHPIVGGDDSDAWIKFGKPNLRAAINDHGGGVDSAFGSLTAAIQAFGQKKVEVQGDVKGEAQIIQVIKVEPSPLVIATLQGAQATLKLNLTGKLGQTMKGSNAAMPSVAPGLTSFKPTVSGH